MAPQPSTALFTLEDSKAAFNIFCCVCGIGSLGMPSNYARAGWTFATIALLFMAFANIYSSVLLSKVMMAAPAAVKTYTDLGEWVGGRVGRWAVTISQMGVCLLLPCAFLVLGGSLLDVLFPDSFSQSVWIMFMALMVVPVALIPTMKESGGMALAGCLGTIVADVIGISILIWEERGHPSPPLADVTPHQVITTFGNLSLAYAAATVIPDLQRQHSQPERMPRVIMVSLGIASAFFIAVAIAGYAVGGCQMSGNLLFSVANTSDPFATTTLGFVADRGAVIMAYLFMQLHLSMAFSTFLHPAFYLFERVILGMHKTDPITNDGEIEIEEKMSSYMRSSTPADLESNNRLTRASVAAHHHDEDDLSEYTGGANVLRYIGLRISIIVILVVLSILLRDHFLDLSDFTGATAITMSSLILPIIFYLMVFWTKVPAWEKLLCVAVAVICTVCGIYVMIYAGKNLFNPDDDDTTFPYCTPEFQEEPYYVRNSTD
ncbi:hypothetical protein PHYSODRAFT_257226 [Phytophthora sojae]|uniref:Amino acid transporter transmembrane domain-containing protein n=1 Tax=Phytophthora sojae (strain P6497) TaxID=1094619 RepID=G4ZTD0_PHYSP|nr:hypothetical protein PHYSODRAFT_257226 [Phytophthora sojae]EGZ12894.1 hypothetical protein PHYSODRAFT_257226 [Phytophthora sojae]|eukprot:XP_009530323.1 hypothetical protein PHYSODRAFT_257226 [Phytophthora sojae]